MSDAAAALDGTSDLVWADPDPRFLRAKVPPAPRLPLADVLGPQLAQWVTEAAEAKSAPPDFVFAGLLSVAAAVIGNTRWIQVWRGWTEPPVIWTMCVGLPSSGKSPALDAVLQPLRKVEAPIRVKAEEDRARWNERGEVAKVAEKNWKIAVEAAIKSGDALPSKPPECELGPKPHVPRLVVNDCTIERLGEIVDRQPRGTLQFRDELAGWLDGMTRYTAASDRPFWLEAYGGRGFSVERMSREPLTIERLTIGVMGGIQPDRLKSLLLKADDDGLLARFVPIWPEPAPLKRPGSWAEEGLLQRVLEKLWTLDMLADDLEGMRPMLIPFGSAAQALMEDFRQNVRIWEDKVEGLLLSFIGKLPGLSARLALLLAYLDWAAEGDPLPHQVDAEHFARAANLINNYVLPMARRSYAEASVPKDERAARQLVSIICEQRWERFTSRQAMKLGRSGLSKAAELDPALAILEDADILRYVDRPQQSRGGRPLRLFLVNPAIHA